MTDISLPAPVDGSTSAPAAQRRVTPAVVVAAVAGVVNATLAVTQLISPAQPESGAFVRTSDYLIEYQFAVTLILTAVAVTLLAAVHRTGAMRWGVFGN